MRSHESLWSGPPAHSRIPFVCGTGNPILPKPASSRPAKLKHARPHFGNVRTGGVPSGSAGLARWRTFSFAISLRSPVNRRFSRYMAWVR